MAADFERALALAPASSQVHTMRAVHYLVPTGRLGEAEEEMERAVEFDPVSPLAYIELGKVLLWERQFDRAQAKLDAAFELRPDYPPAIWYRGAGLFFRGAFGEGLSFAQEAMQRLGHNPAMMGGIGMALGFLGRHAEAREMLNELAVAERECYVSPIGRALIYLGLGETDSFFEWLAARSKSAIPTFWSCLSSHPMTGCATTLVLLRCFARCIWCDQRRSKFHVWKGRLIDRLDWRGVLPVTPL